MPSHPRRTGSRQLPLACAAVVGVRLFSSREVIRESQCAKLEGSPPAPTHPGTPPRVSWIDSLAHRQYTPTHSFSSKRKLELSELNTEPALRLEPKWLG